MIVKRSEFQRVVSEDPNPDASYLEQSEWADRLAAYKRNEFSLMGVQARVELLVPLAENISVFVPIITPGAWGIESDSSQEDFDEQFEFECAMLVTMLTALGKIEVVP